MGDHQFDPGQTVNQGFGNGQASAPLFALDLFLLENRFDAEHGILRIPQPVDLKQLSTIYELAGVQINRSSGCEHIPTNPHLFQRRCAVSYLGIKAIPADIGHKDTSVLIDVADGVEVGQVMPNSRNVVSMRLD